MKHARTFTTPAQLDCLWSFLQGMGGHHTVLMSNAEQKHTGTWASQSKHFVTKQSKYLNTHEVEQLTKPDIVLHCHFAEQIHNLNINLLTSDKLALEEPAKELFQAK